MTFVSKHLTQNQAILVILPEAASDHIILDLGEMLADNGFFIRSGMIFKGKREIVDLMYQTGPTKKDNRVKNISKSFVSYSEYGNQPCATILLEQVGTYDTPAIERLNKLKGNSRHPERETLRGISTLTRHMYSYVHVPDNDTIDDVVQWALPPIKDVSQLNMDNNKILWKTIQEILTFHHHPQHVSDVQEWIQQIAQHCLRVLLISNLIVVLSNLNEEDKFSLLQSEPAKQISFPHLKEIINKFRAAIPTNGYAYRRLKLLIETAALLLDDERRNIFNGMNLAELLDAIGISLHPSRYQLLLSTFLQEN
ncbi:hypothetical protein [Brevibacillus gelatini]